MISLSFVFGRQYHWNETQTGISFLGLGSGSLLGLVFVYWWSDRISVSLAKKHGAGKPEVAKFRHCLHMLVPVSTVLLAPVFDAAWPAALWMVS
jgi:hypothetical protein